MNTAASKRGATPAILPEICSLIETSRNYAVTTANLALVNRNWQIGRILTEDIQSNARRADYGQHLFERLAESLTRDYGSGFSISNLSDMRRFFEQFEILQALPVKSLKKGILQAVPVELHAVKREGKLAVSEYRTQLPDKKLLEERLRIYSRLLATEGDAQDETRK